MFTRWVNTDSIFDKYSGTVAAASKELKLWEAPKSEAAVKVIPKDGRFIVFKEFKNGRNGTVRKAAYDGAVGYVDSGDFYLYWNKNLYFNLK